MPRDTLPDLNSADTLYRLAYISRWRELTADGSPASEDLNDIFATSRRNNSKVDLTGILLHSNGALIQVIEGPLGAMEETFERISQDMRHTDLKLIDYAPVHKRHFGDWMASELGAGQNPTHPHLQTRILNLFDQLEADANGVDIVSQITEVLKSDKSDPKD